VQELLLCVAALVLGPLLYQITTHKAKTYSFSDGFVLVGVGWLVLVELLPEYLETLGLWALPMAAIGFVFPHFLERRLESLPVSPRTILSSLIIVGLLVHQLLDGAALYVGGGADGVQAHVSSLAFAVILHQFPKGFILWEIVRKASGIAAAILVILALVAATAVGFFLGRPVLDALEDRLAVMFQCFIAGGLLHVVLHHIPGSQEMPPRPLWGGLGALAALGFFISVLHGHTHTGAGEDGASEAFLHVFLSLALESSAPILAGLLAAGVLQAFVPAGPMSWFQGRNSLSQALRGIILGTPLPICSCGVTPLYRTLVHRRVPAAAALAFLIATPEIGFDAVFISVRLLGWEMTLFRLGMAFGVAVLAACILARHFERSLPEVHHPAHAGEQPVKAPPGLLPRARNALRFGFVETVDSIGAWLVAGLALAAALEPFLKPEWAASIPRGLDIVIFSLLGMPLYVCASGATPLAAVLLAKGISPGAVLAFLITGPTTNMTTFGILSRLHGRALAVAFALVVFLLCVAFGFAVNLLAGPVEERAQALLESETHGWFQYAAAVILAAIIGFSILRLGPRGFIARLGTEAAEGQHRH
jgi:uncharacterized membrane protein YraQ (UPF0718 family)